MKTLTTEQVVEFNDNGFLVINDVFSETDLEEIRAACEAGVVKEFLAQPHTGFSFHWLEITTKHPVFMKLAKHPNIIAIIKPLLGEDIQLQHSKLAVKLPGRGRGSINWHQDFAFFPHTNTSLVAVMVALDDIGPDNGGMQVIKGSHKLGLQNHLDLDGNMLGNCNDAASTMNADLIVNICPKSGGISIHHCLTIHKSDDNLTPLPRRAIVFEYRTADAMQLADGIWEDTGIVVSGSYKGQVRLEAGVYPLPRSTRYGENLPFGHAWCQFGALAKKESPIFKVEKNTEEKPTDEPHTEPAILSSPTR